MVGTAKFEARIKELVENLPDLAILIEPLLIVRRALREQVVILHRRLLAIVRDDAVCRRGHGVTQVHIVAEGQTTRQCCRKLLASRIQRQSHTESFLPCRTFSPLQCPSDC
jgi:hypothetical protein